MQKIPMEIEERFNEIMNIIEVFCKEKLNEDYYILAKNLCEEICSLENASIKKGKANSWACGIVHALGLRNGFLNGKNDLVIKAGELYKAFEVSSSTGLAKSKEIRNIINIDENRWAVENLKSSDIKEEVCATIQESCVKKLPSDIQDNDLKEAIKIANEAWEQKNFNKKVKMAKKALSISKDCTEAYIILSYNNAIAKQEQKALVIQAVEASIRVLGDNKIEDYMGKILDLEIPKQYYSAKYRLANLLWSIGEGKEAIEVFKELIRLCPEDRLLIRGTLVSWLISENMYEDANKLIDMFKNDYLASMKFSKALMLFKQGNLEDAQRALKIASVANTHVIDYIIKYKRVPNVLPEYKGFGTEEEAMYYVKNGELAWNTVEGAIEWIKDFRKNQPF